MFPQRNYLISRYLFGSPKATVSAYSGCQKFYRTGSRICWRGGTPGSPWVIHPRYRLRLREAGPFPGSPGQCFRLPCGLRDKTGLRPWEEQPHWQAPTGPKVRSLPGWRGGSLFLFVLILSVFALRQRYGESLSVSFLSFDFGYKNLIWKSIKYLLISSSTSKKAPFL